VCVRVPVCACVSFSQTKVMGTVNFDFAGTESNQITIHAGETIEIVTQGDSGGWSQGTDLSGIMSPTYKYVRI
jgi:hypothetical protein